MAAKAISPKPHFSAQQEDHLRAVFFNCISDAYCAGMATGSRSKKDALGSRQILDDLKMMINDDKKHSKYLRVIADTVEEDSTQVVFLLGTEMRFRADGFGSHNTLLGKGIERIGF